MLLMKLKFDVYLQWPINEMLDSLVNATFGSWKKSCEAKFVLTKLVNTTWREMGVIEGISISLYVLSEECELFDNAF